MVVFRTMVAIFGLMMIACSERGNWPVNAFSAEEWRATQEDKRYVFARDIVQREVLLGRTSVEIYAMLGKPSSVSTDLATWKYLVKAGSRVSFAQVYVIQLSFDSGGRVCKVVIVGD